MAAWKTCWFLALVLDCSLLTIGSANAGVLKYESTVNVLAGSSVDGVTLTSDTLVSFTGLFDSNDMIFDDGTFSFYMLSSLQIEVDGLGTFEALFPDEVAVMAAEFDLGITYAVVGLVDTVDEGGYVGFYETYSAPFQRDALGPNLFSDWTAGMASAFPFYISLTSPNGDFEAFVDDASPMTASLSIVPEPSTLAVFGIGAATVLLRRKRRAAR